MEGAWVVSHVIASVIPLKNFGNLLEMARAHAEQQSSTRSQGVVDTAQCGCKSRHPMLTSFARADHMLHCIAARERGVVC